jgi:CheY-like chemotaxis protein
MRAVIRGIGEAAGYDTFEAAGVREIDEAIEQDPDVIVLDMIMPEQDGIEVLWKLAAIKSAASIFILSGYDPQILDTASVIGRAQGLNVVATLCKPIDCDDLKSHLQALKSA